MATIGKIAQGADKVDDLVATLWRRAAGKKVNINRMADGVISFATANGTASATRNLPFGIQMASLKLNNGDTFTRTITDSKICDGVRLAGKQIVDPAKGHQAGGLWELFLKEIFG